MDIETSHELNNKLIKDIKNYDNMYVSENRLSIFSQQIPKDIEIDEVKPMSEMNYQEIWQLAYKILTSTCSVCIGLLLQMSILSINLHFVGQLEDPIYLDAIGLSIVIMNCTAGYIMAFNQGTGSYIGRAFGKKNINLMYNYFSKGLFMFIVLYFILSIVLIYSSDILQCLGQHEELSIQTQRFGTAVLPGIFANYLFDLIRNYLNGQQIFRDPFIILAIGLPVHCFICFTFFEEYGVDAIIFSTNFTYILILCILAIYLIKKNLVPKLQFSTIFINFKDYLNECNTIALPIFIDIIGFEINSILIGTLHDLKQFGAHVAFANFTQVLYSVPIGMGGAFMLLSSNAVGQNSAVQVVNLEKLTLLIGTVLGIIFTILMILFRVQISQYYSSDLEIQQYFSTLVLVYACFCILDFVCQGMSGLLKGIGKSKSILISFAFAYYAIGMTCSIYLGLYTSLQVVGFWIGFGFSILSISIMLFVIVKKTDIQTQVSSVHSKLELEGDNLEGKQVELQEMSSQQNLI